MNKKLLLIRAYNKEEETLINKFKNLWKKGNVKARIMKLIERDINRRA